MLYLGIDPGVGGGFGLIAYKPTVSNPDPEPVISAWKMPDTARELWRLFKTIKQNAGVHQIKCCLELANSSPQMGRVSVGTFMMGKGMLLMGLTASLIQFDQVAPLKWQNALGCRTYGDKHVSKMKAHGLFPTTKVTNYTADALLLAEYCRRLHLTGFQKPQPSAKPVNAKSHRMNIGKLGAKAGN